MKNIFFTLTYQCNAFCEKCMTRKHVYNNYEISEEIINRFVLALSQNDYRGLISMGSGESLLSPYLVPFVQKLFRVNDDIKLRVLTNGVLLDCDQMDDILQGNRITWGITLDGFSQEELLKLQYGVDVELVKRNVEKWCNKKGPENLYLNYTLNAQNLDGVLPFVEWASELGIKDIYITELKIYKPYYSKLAWAALDYQDEHTLRVVEKLLADKRVVCSLKTNAKIRSNCWCIDRIMPIIDIDGSFSFCSGREDFVVGNILDDDAAQKWLAFSSEVKQRTGWCKECHDRMDENGLYSFPKNKYKY